MLRVPVFHVNGEDPEAVIQVTRLAIEFRQRFKQDVVIDMYCYRKYGHNEGDEPRFTQPVMYSLIDKKPTVREVYVARLVAAGHISRDEANAIAEERRATLELALEEARKGDFHQMPEAMGGVWAPYRGGPDAGVPEVSTAYPKDKLAEAVVKLATVPEGFHPNPKVLKLLEQRRDRALAGQSLDWEPPSTWHTRRSCSRAMASASVVRTLVAERSPTATRPSSTPRRASPTFLWPTWETVTTASGASRSTTRL